MNPGEGMKTRPTSVRILGTPSTKRPSLFRMRHGHRELLLGSGTITLGRKASCDYVLNDTQVSREHARIIVGEQTFAVEDLGSANGVYVNDAKVHGLKRLNDGDVLRIGSQIFNILEVPESAQEEKTDDVTVIASTAPRNARTRLLDEDWEDRPTRVLDPMKP